MLRRQRALSERIKTANQCVHQLVCLEVMSDEESDEDGKPLLWVSELPWRSRCLAEFLHGLDTNSRLTCERRKRPVADASQAIPRALPINFYSEDWIRTSPQGIFVTENSAKPVEF
jgi:hypothetical protein